MDIAILDDDPFQRELLATLVRAGGHVAALFGTGSELLDALCTRSFDMLLLDWTMPTMSGADVLAEVRGRHGLGLPVIVVTATDDEATLVVALRRGADDFVAKPVKGMELLARIEALSRRARAVTTAPLRAGRVVVERDRRRVSVDDAPVELTAKEFDLAAYVIEHPGELLSRARLLDAVWGVTAQVDTRTVDTHASRVRRKLGLDGSSGWTLQSVYGVGYRLVPTQ